jgi:hypothetical protein
MIEEISDPEQNYHQARLDRGFNKVRNNNAGAVPELLISRYAHGAFSPQPLRCGSMVVDTIAALIRQTTARADD